MKKSSFFTGAAVIGCALMGSGAAAHAQSLDIRPPAVIGIMPMIVLPEINPPEIGAGMSIYEQYGLFFNQDKGSYLYNGKTVRLFVDRQGRGIYFLNQNGEVNVEALRDSNGRLTGLEELSAAEYTQIVAEMDTRMAELHVQMEQNINEMNARIEEHMREFPQPILRLDIAPPPAPKM